MGPWLHRHQRQPRLRLPVAGVYLRWGLTEAGGERSWRLEVRREAPAGVGQYLAVDNATIDGAGFYLGVQTDLHHPSRGYIGPGLIFSSWATRSGADVDAGPGGFVEVGAHEGGFVGVRRPCRLDPGVWQLTLARSGRADSSAGPGDRWVLSATGPDGRLLEVGSILFPRVDPAAPGRVDAGGTGFWELYSGAARASDVPLWEVAVMAHGVDGTACTRGEVLYPRFPDRPRFAAVDAHYEPATGLVAVSAGGATTTTHRPGPWSS